MLLSNKMTQQNRPAQLSVQQMFQIYRTCADCEMEVSLPHNLNINRPVSPLTLSQSCGDTGDSTSVCANVILTHWNEMGHLKFYCFTVVVANTISGRVKL